MMRMISTTALAIAFAASLAFSAVAGNVDAARGWSNSTGFKTSNESNSAFNRAFVERQLRKGYKGPGTVVYSNSTTTTNCKVAGACQTGGESTNVNGYSATTINGDGNAVDTNIDAQSEQDASATSIVEGCCIIQP